MTNNTYKTLKQMFESGDKETVTLGLNMLGAAMSNSDFNLAMLLVNNWLGERINIASAIINLFQDDSDDYIHSIVSALKMYCLFRGQLLERDVLTIKQKIELISKEDYKKIKKLIPKSVVDTIEFDMNNDSFDFFATLAQ